MGQNLTSVASFKKWANIESTSTTDDGLIQDMITGASYEILAYLDRKSLFKNTFTDYYDGTGSPILILRQWPVLSVTSVLFSAVAQTAAVQPNNGYFLEPWDGWPPGKMQSLNMIGGTGDYPQCGAIFPRGIKNISVTYICGYSVQDESAIVPASPYQITAEQSYGPWAQDDGVTMNGTPLTKVTSNPATGQYSVDDGVYSFASANVAATVLINYSYVPASIARTCNDLVNEQYSYRSRTGQKSHSLGGQVTTSFDNKIFTDAIKGRLQPFKRMVPW